MKVPFEVHLSKDIGSEFLSDIVEAVNRTANRVADHVAISLILLADQQLHTTKQKYIGAISIKGTGIDTSVVLSETEWIVARIENGFPSFDMKPGMLKGPKSKVSKNGIRYNIIPIKKDGILTFRIVTDKSPANSWIHPGMTGRPLIAEVIEMYKKERLIDNILNEELAKVLNK